MSDSIRVYAVADMSLTLTLGQLGSLKSALVQEPFVGKIVQYGNKHNQPHIGFNTRVSTLPIRRYVWCEFELDGNDVSEAQAFIDQQCSNRGIVQPTYLLRVQNLLLAELVESGLGIGLTSLVTNLFTCSVVGWGDRDTAIGDSVQNMIANCVQWGDC